MPLHSSTSITQNVVRKNQRLTCTRIGSSPRPVPRAGPLSPALVPGLGWELVDGAIGPAFGLLGRDPVGLRDRLGAELGRPGLGAAGHGLAQGLELETSRGPYGVERDVKVAGERSL